MPRSQPAHPPNTSVEGQVAFLYGLASSIEEYQKALTPEVTYGRKANAGLSLLAATTNRLLKRHAEQLRTQAKRLEDAQAAWNKYTHLSE